MTTSTVDTIARSVDPAPSIFEVPPADPIGLFREWWQRAIEQGVRDPGAFALATADRSGRASNRTVQLIRVSADGLVFSSHAGSQKGRELAATGWASAVLYWREVKQQVILSGPVQRLSEAESDALWAERPVATHPMSVASVQSALLDDEEALRTEAQRLAGSELPLTRPAGWSGYLLTPDAVEFCLASSDRLHRRLRYDKTPDGWTTSRLQP